MTPWLGKAGHRLFKLRTHFHDSGPRRYVRKSLKPVFFLRRRFRCFLYRPRRDSLSVPLGLHQSEINLCVFVFEPHAGQQADKLIAE